MTGACNGCPSSTLTLKHGIEQMLKHYIPQVSEVVSIDEKGEAEPRISDEDLEFQRKFDEELNRVIQEELENMQKEKQNK